MVVKKPQNLSFTTKALKDADLVISIASTILIEQALRGVAICSITDFGFSEVYSNEVFIGSKTLKSFDDFVNPQCKFDINKDWLLGVASDYNEGILSLVDLLKNDKITKNVQQNNKSSERWIGI